jgi:hypothetical protein
MKNLYLIILLAAFAACSLFKNSSRQVELDMASFSMQLWPKGVFTYSAAQGFKGEAEKILISGKTKRGTATSRQENYSAGTKSDQKLTASESTVDKTESSKKETHRTVSWKIIVAAVLMLALVGWLVIRWLKNR